MTEPTANDRTSVRVQARRAVLPASHKACEPTDCYRASEVEAFLLALIEAGYAVVPVAELYDHADGNVGDGCWALHDRYAPSAKTGSQT